MNSSVGGAVNDIYSGAATFGHFWAYIQAFFSTLVMIGLIIFGIYILWTNAHLTTVIGTITRANYNCTTTQNQNNKITTCYVDVTYTINGKQYQQSYSTATQYTVGATVTVYYNPTDPKDSSISQIPNWMAWLAIGGGIFIGISSWIWVWLTGRYKFLGAAAGVSDVWNIFR